MLLSFHRPFVVRRSLDLSTLYNRGQMHWAEPDRCDRRPSCFSIAPLAQPSAGSGRGAGNEDAKAVSEEEGTRVAGGRTDDGRGAKCIVWVSARRRHRRIAICSAQSFKDEHNETEGGPNERIRGLACERDSSHRGYPAAPCPPAAPCLQTGPVRKALIREVALWT